MPSIKDILDHHAEDPAKLIQVLCVDTNETRAPEVYKEEYDGTRTRRLKSVGMRPTKTIEIVNDQGVKTGETKTIYPAKLIFPFPKKIVRTATHFLFGGTMSVSSDENNDAINEFTRVWTNDLKMQTNMKRLARICMTETKAALLFYPQPVKDEEDPTKTKMLKLRCMVLDKDSGEFYPHFDDYGDMDAFIRKFQVSDIEGKQIEKAVIYTKDMTLYLTNESGWDHEKGKKENLFGKIPVVYVEQDLPEWEDVAALIDDFETRISRLADTNDYFAEPLLKIFGDINKAPSKEEVGKVVHFEMKQDLDGKISHGDAEYAVWDHTPESIKLELETVKDGIFSGSSTPDLSFNNVMDVKVTSGKALILMFMDALIKKEEKGEIFFDAIKRSVSVVVAGITGYTTIKLEDQLAKDNVKINFTGQLPDDLAETIDTLVTATGGKAILSQESAASISPFTSDPKEENKRLKGEKPVPNESFNM